MSSKTKQQEISVIVMSVNSDSKSLGAVESVLDQCDEIIVVNSGKGTLRNILEKHMSKINLIEMENIQMPGGTRNVGVINSTRKIVTFLAADCRAQYGSLEKRLNYHNAGYEIVSSCLRPHFNTIPSWASYIYIHNKRMPERSKESGGMFGASYSRVIFEKHGMFNEVMRIAEDAEFNSRLNGVSSKFATDIITTHEYPEGMALAVSEIYYRTRREVLFKKRSPMRQAVSEILKTLKLFLTVAIHPKYPRMARISAPAIIIIGISASIGSLSLYWKK